jgi:hypothetical protein
MVYLVSYDLLHAQEKDYPELLNALRADGAVRILYSEWLVESSRPAIDVANRYQQHIHVNDRLFVCEVTQNCAYYNIQNEQAAEKKFFAYLRAV